MLKFASSYILIYIVADNPIIVNVLNALAISAIYLFLHNLFTIKKVRIVDAIDIIILSQIPDHLVKLSTVNVLAILSNK